MSPYNIFLVQLVCLGLVALALAPSYVHAAGSSYTQRAVLLGEGGAYPFISIGDQDVPDLTTWEYNKQAHYVCVIGTWLFYDDVNYNANSNTESVELVFGHQNCAPLLELGGRVSSVRPVGSKLDYSAATITLYTNLYFQGPQQYAEGDIATTSFNASSLIITGSPNDSWTLFLGPQYTQPLACISPPDNDQYAPGVLPDVSGLGSIASVRKGCIFGVETIRISSVASQNRQNVFKRTT